MRKWWRHGVRPDHWPDHPIGPPFRVTEYRVYSMLTFNGERPPLRIQRHVQFVSDKEIERRQREVAEAIAALLKLN